MNIEQLHEKVEKDVINLQNRYTTEVAELKEKFEQFNLLIEEKKETEDVESFFKEVFLIGSGEAYNDKVEELMEYVDTGDLKLLESYGIENTTNTDRSTLDILIQDAVAGLITTFTSKFSRDLKQIAKEHGLVPTILDKGVDTDLKISFEPDKDAPAVMLACYATNKDSKRKPDFKKEVMEKYNLSIVFPEAPLSQENQQHFFDVYKRKDAIVETLTKANNDIQRGIDFLEGIEKFDRYLTRFYYDFYGMSSDYRVNGIFLF